jgi:predicted amidohydrolase
MAEAKEKGADVSHFPESSLNGYAGTDFNRYKSQDEALRLDSLEKIIQLSSELKIWVIVGGHH